MSIGIDELKSAVNLMEEAIASSADKIPNRPNIDPIPRVLRAGVIKIFENTFDMACTFITKWLKENTLVNEFRLLTSKDIFYFADQSNLISHPDYWNKFFEYRKISSKSFNQSSAAQIYKIALEFFPEVKSMLSKVQS